MNHTFTDSYGDTLRLFFHGATVDFDAREGGVTASLDFSNEDAVAIAHCILENTDAEVPQAEAKAPVDPVTLFSGQSGNERFEWNRVAALAAKQLGLELQFRYTKSDTAPVETRTLSEVTDVLESSEGQWLVIGHSDERDDARSFRIDRMVSYAIVG